MAKNETKKQTVEPNVVVDPATGRPGSPTNAPEGKQTIDAATGKPANPNNAPVDAPASRYRVTGPGAGVKPLGEPDQGIEDKSGPEQPTLAGDGTEADGDDDGESDAAPKRKRKGGKGTVTYRFSDGSAATADVDDVANPPVMKHDELGEGVVEE